MMVYEWCGVCNHGMHVIQHSVLLLQQLRVLWVHLLQGDLLHHFLMLQLVGVEDLSLVLHTHTHT
jgi:hypothetical protein